MLVRLTCPAPVAVAAKLAPFVSVTKTPPEPAAAFTVPAGVSIEDPAAPMPLRARGRSRQVDRARCGVESVPAAWVIEPPVILAPVSVLTVIVPAALRGDVPERRPTRAAAAAFTNSPAARSPWHSSS